MKVHSPFPIEFPQSSFVLPQGESEVDPEKLQSQVLDRLQKLIEAKVVDVLDASPAASAREGAPDAAPVEPVAAPDAPPVNESESAPVPGAKEYSSTKSRKQ